MSDYKDEFPKGFLDWVAMEYGSDQRDQILKYGIGMSKRIRDDLAAWEGCLSNEGQAERERLKRFATEICRNQIIFGGDLIQSIKPIDMLIEEFLAKETTNG